MSLRDELETIERQSRGNPVCPMYITRDKVVSHILAKVAEVAEKEMPICPPMNDREDIVVSLTNQRRAGTNWLKRQ